MTSAPELSPVAVRLGYAGLVPFVVGALLVWILPQYEDTHAFAAQALASYAALIVSFLGGIHWGIGFREPHPEGRMLAWGVVPSLVAWPAVLMPANAGLVILGVMLVVCYLVDRRVYARHGLAHWLTLRFRLSTVAGFACFLAAAAT